MKKIGTDKGYVNNDSKHKPELEVTKQDFQNTSNKLICKDYIDDSTPAQEIFSGRIFYVKKKTETDSDIGISEDDEPKASGEVKIHDTLDIPEYTIISEDLNNQINHKLEDIYNCGD